MKLVMEFRVDGLPKGQPRPRRAGSRPGVYTPPTADEWKRNVRYVALLFAAAAPKSSATAAFRIEITWWMPRPKTHFGSGRNADKLRPAVRRFPTTKPDLDNLEKATVDALCHHQLSSCLWRDDSQVVEALTKKRYCDPVNGRPEPGADIAIYVLEEQDS